MTPSPDCAERSVSLNNSEGGWVAPKDPLSQLELSGSPGKGIQSDEKGVHSRVLFWFVDQSGKAARGLQGSQHRFTARAESLRRGLCNKLLTGSPKALWASGPGRTAH